MGSDNVLLEVKDLKTYFFLDEGVVKAVDGVDFDVERYKTLCIVGESGCGKSVTAHSVLQIIESPGRVVDGQILFHMDLGKSNTGTLDLAKLDPQSAEIRAVRGKEIAMIFQEPMTALSPVHTIGHQMLETMQLHLPISKEEARERSIESLRRVGIPQPERRLDAYSFELSGGMRQRAMIAIALSCTPRLLIADEPTTAVDVTTQAQILDLILELQQDYGTAVQYITHDLGVVAEIADNVVVMYLGRTVEVAEVDPIFHDPLHPYTRALLRSLPKLDFRVRERLDSIRGMVPDPHNRPPGCTFGPRCDSYIPGTCDYKAPPLITLEDGRKVRCWLYGGQGKVVPASAETEDIR